MPGSVAEVGVVAQLFTVVVSDVGAVANGELTHWRATRTVKGLAVDLSRSVHVLSLIHIVDRHDCIVVERIPDLRRNLVEAAWYCDRACLGGNRRNSGDLRTIGRIQNKQSADTIPP